MAKEKAKLDHREWFLDIAAGAAGAMVAGAVGALLVPEPPLRYAIFVAGIVGLVNGLVNAPLRILFSRLAGRDDAAKDLESDHES